MDNELQSFLDTYLYKQLKDKKLTDDEICKLKFEMQQDIEIACNDVFVRADRFIKGEIIRYGLLI